MGPLFLPISIWLGTQLTAAGFLSHHLRASGPDHPDSHSSSHCGGHLGLCGAVSFPFGNVCAAHSGFCPFVNEVRPMALSHGLFLGRLKCSQGPMISVPDLLGPFSRGAATQRVGGASKCLP